MSAVETKAPPHRVAHPVLAFPPSVYTSSNPGTSFSTVEFRTLMLYIILGPFAGGASPSITFFVDRLGADGVWYPVWESEALASSGSLHHALGPSDGSTRTTTTVLTGTARFGWRLGGSPASVTFSATVVGRP